MTDSVLDRIRAQVASLTADEVKEQLVKLQAVKEGKKKSGYVRGSASRGPKGPQSEEEKERAKEYRNRPEVKEKQRLARKEKYDRQQALIAKAIAMGITGDEKKKKESA